LVSLRPPSVLFAKSVRYVIGAKLTAQKAPVEDSIETDTASHGVVFILELKPKFFPITKLDKLIGKLKLT
jgi:hypothetical protein